MWLLLSFGIRTHGQAATTGNGFLVGSKLSLADVQLFSFLETLDNQDRLKEVLATHPKVHAAVTAVATHPAVVAWQAARPVTMF